MESEEMKAARHIVNGQFMNQMIFRIMDGHSRRRGNQQSVGGQCSKPLLIIAGITELLFWGFVVIVLGGTFLLSLAGIFMLIFHID